MTAPARRPRYQVMQARAQPRPRRPWWPALRGALAAVLTLCLWAAGARAAQPATGEISVKAPQAVLMDAGSGAIMYQRNGEELMYPASMSKLMLLAVVFRALKDGEVGL